MDIVTLPTGTPLDLGQEALRQALGHDPVFSSAPAARGHGTVEIGVFGLSAAAARGKRTAARDTLVLPVRLHGATALVGPVHDRSSDGRPCSTCLHRRWIRLRPVRERQALERNGDHHVVGPLHPVLVAWGTSAVAAALLRLATERTARAEGGRAGTGRGSQLAAVLEVDLATGRTTRHSLLAEPDCPDCASRWPDTPLAMTGFPSSRPWPRPGSTRMRGWREYRIPQDALVNPVCGALGSAAIPILDAAVNAPVGGLLRLGGESTDGAPLYEIKWGGHAETYAESEVLGLLEALERYAGQSPRGRSRAARASLRELRDLAVPALDPRSVPLYRDDFYARNAGTYQPFHPERRLDWVWGHAVLDDTALLVPEQLAYYGHGRPGEAFVAGSSSGCATGSCLEEAVLYGLLELVERDAFLLTWFSARHLEEIDPASCVGLGTTALADRIAGLGYQLRLFDLRVDLPIPVVLCVARRRDGGFGQLCLSAGSALDPQDAVVSAVREVATYLPGFAARVEAEQESLRAMVADYALVRQLDDHGLLYGLPEMADRAAFLWEPSTTEPRALDEVFADWTRTRPASTDLLEDLRHCARLVGRVTGGDVIVADQTSPEQKVIGLSTAVVIAPGLLPLDFGWERQRALDSDRLRTAAWRAGLRPAPLRDADIHRHPHPFL
ncbi:TOMM precursor leader peptide-binding protein [Streptomyces sp. KR80]|uniref:TOMM precursor leader peptide-binding protein n=1 Tax=Streptomyces sp. KR80 TaxID=3457426 RepID=UPI003FD3ED1B